MRAQGTRPRRGPAVALLPVLCLVLATGCASAPAKRFRPAVTPAGSMLGVSSLESHDERLAGALLELRIRRTPEHLARVGDQYARVGVLDTAMDYYTASLDRDSRYVPALDGAARIWRAWGEFGPALGSAYRATHFAPASPEAWNTLGTVFQAIGQTASAEAAYRKAAALDPAAAYASSNLCYLAFLQAQADEALAHCTVAVSSDSRLVAARNNLALVHAASGDNGAAFDAFAAAGNEAAAHFNIGIVLLAGRQYEAAVLAFEAAYRAEPDFEQAHVRARQARLRALAAKETTDGSR
jgi:Flp pilus assembly protein TadD